MKFDNLADDFDSIDRQLITGADFYDTSDFKVANPVSLSDKDKRPVEFHFITEDTLVFGDMGPLEPVKLIE